MPAALLTIKVVSPGAPNDRLAASKKIIEQSNIFIFLSNGITRIYFNRIPKISLSEAKDGSSST
jgi:hypothetical protein